MLSRSLSALAIFAPLLFAFTYFFFHVSESGFSAQGTISRRPTSRGQVRDVKNETLGFSQIFVIALPERSDKRDAFSISASFTGFKFDWIEGVNGEDVPQKAIPQGWEKEESSHTLGCWRAHMNAVQRIVKEQIPSALILEDDADWDVTIKSQLVEFAKGSRFLQGLEPKSTSINSPYGDDWDLLWLGHCGTRNREGEDGKYYVIHDDPTAVPQSLWGYPRRRPNLTAPALRGNFTRVIYEPIRGLCMYGYALSLRGAQRLLYHQAISGQAKVSDKALQIICNNRYMGFKCIAPYPTLIGTHRAAGATAKDSDRVNTESVQGGFRTKAWTGDIVYSSRTNLESLAAGNQMVKSQWPNKTLLAEVDRSMDLPQGRGVWVTKDMYEPYKRPD